MTLRAIDCQGFAGGMTLGVVQSGWTLVGKRELPGGFGAANCLANRHLLGDTWDYEEGPWESWSAPGAEMVFGNPPCSGFSVLSSKEFRGMESKINACMHALIDYAVKVKPEIVVMESVTQAFTQGLPLMQHLRDKLEMGLDEAWYMTHVKHNALSHGGAAMRKRYFLVLSRAPFGVEYPEPRKTPTLNDVIGDLQHLPLTMKPQRYDDTPVSWWAQPKLSKSGWVDGQVGLENLGSRRISQLLERDPWPEGDDIHAVAKRIYSDTCDLPMWAPEKVEKLVANDFNFGFYSPHRWKGGNHARVITGGAMSVVVHPTQPRLLTHRESARIMGFPDDWLIEPIKTKGLHATWGKGVTVESGRWIAEWAKKCVEGNPGSYRGEVIGDDERLIDVTYAYRGTPAKEVAA